MFSCFRASAVVPSSSASAIAVVPAKPPTQPTCRVQVGPVDNSDAAQALVEKIRSSVIGSDVVVQGPFGPRRISYADFTASGRSLSCAYAGWPSINLTRWVTGSLPHRSHRGLHSRRRASLLRQHAHRVVWHGAPNVALSRGGSFHCPRSRGRGRRARRDFLRLWIDGSYQPRHLRARPPGAVRARGATRAPP